MTPADTSTSLTSRINGMDNTYTYTHNTQFFFLFFFNLTYSRWTSSLPSCLGHKGSSHLSPVHALQFFIAMQVRHSYSSATKLNFTYSRSHAFRYERNEHKSYLLVRIELTTSALLPDYNKHITVIECPHGWSFPFVNITHFYSLLIFHHESPSRNGNRESSD